MFKRKGEIPLQQSPEVKYELGRRSKTELERLRRWYYGVMTASQSLTDNPPPKNISDPESHNSQEPKAIWRRIGLSRDSVSRVTSLHKTTERIIANSHSILEMLQSDHPVATHLNQEEYQSIKLFLEILADDQCIKGYSGKTRKANDRGRSGEEPMKQSNDKLDKRSKEKTKHELAIYLKIDNILNQWKEFMNGEGEQPSLAETLRLGPKLVKKRVETIDDRLEQLGQEDNSIAIYEIPMAQQSAEEQAIRFAWKELNELRPRIDEVRSAAESGDLNSVKEYRELAILYESYYKDSVEKTEKGQSSYIPVQERRKRVEDYVNQIMRGGVISSQQRATSILSRTIQTEFYYEVVHPFHDAGENITRDDIYNKMKTERRFSVPVQETDSVEPGSMTEILPRGWGTVKHECDDKNKAVLNEPVDGHLFYPGCVVRWPERLGKIWVVRTIAYGYTSYPLRLLDNAIAERLWRKCDRALEEALLEDQNRLYPGSGGNELELSH